MSLEDFDALMDDAQGKRPAEPKLTSYGPVDPMLDPKNQTQYAHPVAPVGVHPMPVHHTVPVVVPHMVPVPTPYYFDPDPMPRQNAGIHVLLAFTTYGIGNLIYGLHVHEKQQAWRRRRGLAH